MYLSLMRKGQFVKRISCICECGKEFKVREKKIKEGRGKYCSQACKYKYRVRPKGLQYVLVKENPTSFKPGHKTWNTGTKGLMPTPLNFKGDEVGYYALHDWVYRYKGRPDKCEFCGGNKAMQWANKSHEYKRDLEDWLSLCKKCHVKYDRESGNWGVATRKFKRKKHAKKGVCGRH